MSDFDEFKSMAEIEKAEKNKGRKPKDYSAVLELIKNTAIMVAITLVAGGILGLVYEVTKEPIAVMEQKGKNSANRKAMPGATSFSGSILVSEDTENINTASAKVTECIEAYDEAGELMGYVLELTTSEGYGSDPIVFAMGIKNDGTVSAISITSIAETAGLGMRAEEVLVPQFENRLAERFVVTKDGATQPNEIDAISSATRTSNAITNAVNIGLSYFNVYLKGGDE